LKPTTQVPHEGGLRFGRDSEEYKTLQRWIAARLPNERDAAPKLKRIEVSPAERVVVEPANSVQFSARVIFEDGVKRDISRIAVYEPANNLVKVSHDGLVTRTDPSGGNGRAATIPTASSGRPDGRSIASTNSLEPLNGARLVAARPFPVRLRWREDRTVEVRSPAARSRGVWNRNCVAARRGGEQRNENDQSVITSRYTETT